MSFMTDEEQRAHAKRALNAFKLKIATVYQPLLRAVTGKSKLIVQPSAKTTATDGKTVWLMVPWVLGETREHDRSLCNKRDPQSLEMLCPACDQVDRVDCDVFHESAHITADTFVEVDPEKVRPLVKEHLPWVQDPDGLNLPAYYKGNKMQAMPMMHFIEKVYLPRMMNFVEDVYVNRRLFAARAGTELSLQRSTVEIVQRGFKQSNGTHVEWNKQPIDAQAMCAAYLIGERLPWLIDHLSAEVHYLREDPILVQEMEGIPHKGSIYNRIEIAFRVLTRLRELGYCIPPSQKPQPEPEPEPEPEESQDDPDEDEEPEPEDEKLSEDEGDADDQDPGEESDDSEDQSGQSEGDEPEDEASEGDGEADDDAGETEGDDGEPEEGDGTDAQGEPEESDDDDAESEGGDTDDDSTEGDDPGDKPDEADGAGGDDDEADEEDDDADGKGSGGSGSGPGGDEEDDNTDDEGGYDDKPYEEGDDEADDEGDESFPSGSGDPDEGDGVNDEDSGPTPEELDALDDAAAEELDDLLKDMMGHDDSREPSQEPEDGFRPSPDDIDPAAQSALDDEIKWEKFDAPPNGIENFTEAFVEDRDVSGRDDIVLDPGLISGQTAKLRAVFALNRKSRVEGSRKSGTRLDNPNLSRLAYGDYRVFAKKTIPARRNWFVLVGVDDSTSTCYNGANHFLREATVAIGDMLDGCGVKFATYAHGASGKYNTTTRSEDWIVRHRVIKDPDEPWTPDTRERAKIIGTDYESCNFDGHTIEQYRKILDTRPETDKMLLYFTDGEMPAMNFDEEETVLKREINILRQKRVNLFGVGYKTESPKSHGMDTIRVEGIDDLGTLINGLAERLG